MRLRTGGLGFKDGYSQVIGFGSIIRPRAHGFGWARKIRPLPARDERGATRPLCPWHPPLPLRNHVCASFRTELAEPFTRWVSGSIAQRNGDKRMMAICNVLLFIQIPVAMMLLLAITLSAT